jgi:hypothetical protein
MPEMRVRAWKSLCAPLSIDLSEVFDEVWNVALAEVQEHYPEINFPDNWYFTCD